MFALRFLSSYCEEFRLIPYNLPTYVASGAHFQGRCTFFAIRYSSEYTHTKIVTI